MIKRKVYNLGSDRIETSVNQTNRECKVFEEFLDAAFKNPDIRNIAVTGNFGIGKSCFLHHYGKKRKFLYVSGCSFMEPDKLDDKGEMKQVEYNLIYQLLLGCHRNMGSGALQGMPLRQVKFLGVSTGLLILWTVFLLTLAPKLGPYFIERGWYSHTANSIIHIIVYVSLLIILTIDTIAFILRSVHTLSFKSVSLKLGNVKLSIKTQDSASFFCQNRHTLLKSLLDAADQIGHTVVFEDMDRLERADCLSLFTELWELNQEVNLYIGEGEPIRFIYVLHDQLFAPGDIENSAASIAPDAHMQLKFFDYILPIVPKMGQEGAITEAKRLLEEDSDLDEILIKIAPYLADYRLLRTIANEYYVFSEVQKVRRREGKVSGKEEKYKFISDLRIHFCMKNQNNGAENNLPKNVKVKLLGLVIYKNLMPQDYKKIRESSSKVLPTVSEMDEIPEAVQILLNRKWLDASCLKFVYDWESLQSDIKGVFRHGKEYAASKRNWLEDKFDLCCEIEEFDPNLEGAEFTFAEIAVKSGNKKGISILKKYKGSSATEICSENQLEQIHLSLGLNGNESTLSDEEKLTVLHFLSRMDCHILWEIIPDIPNGLDTTESIWWDLFCQIDKDAFTCLVKCCQYEPDDPIGQENYLADWINRSSIFKSTSWEEDVPQDSYEIKDFIKRRLAVPIS